MIVNGNYNFFDFNNNKRKFIEAFVVFYGEEYRDIITERINSINYLPFHSEEYVANAYYDILKKHKGEITDILLNKYNLQRNGVRENILFNENYYNFWEFLYGGEHLASMNIPDKKKEHLLSVRNLITREFCLPCENETQNIIELIKFRLNFVDSIKEIEKKYNYDVLTDIATYEDKYKLALDNISRKAKAVGYIGEVNKLDTINPDEHNSELILFTYDIKNEGLIMAFTSFACDVINNREEKNYERLYFICKRLEYLKLKGVKFKYLNEDLLYNIQTDENINLILQEYDYQKNNILLPSEYVYSSVDNYIKLYSQGEFIPSEIADALELARCEELAEIYSSCMFGSNISKENWIKKLNNEIDYDFFEQAGFDGTIFDSYRNIFVNEDPVLLERDFIQNLIHEINHAISFQFIDNMSGKLYTREGFDEHLFQLNGINVSDYTLYSNDAIIQIEEVFNELQTERILDIFLHLYPDFHIPNYGNGSERMNCDYTNYYFLVKDLYILFEEEIKKAKIDINYNLFKSHGLETNLFKTYIQYYKSKFVNKFKKTGVLDFYKVCELAYLVEYVKYEIMPHIDGMLTEDKLSDSDFMATLPEDIVKKINDVIKKKNKIIRDIIKESPPQLD